ncbi:MAG: radical SAM protein, partial [Eubacterium sp.]|nr:radical SAM protein [Eubacterium sp.]
CKYLDIPIQHSEDSVLKAMKRRSTRNSIMSTVERLRTAMPDIAIRTTLIVGFPGETEEDFDGLYDFVEDTRFNRLGVFAYSQEEGTEAAEMENQIDEEIKEARKDAIMRQQMLISREHNEALVGKKLEVLIDGIDEEGAYLARTQYDAPEIDNLVIVNTDKEHQLGDFITVEIYDAYDYDIVGREI